MNLCFDTNGWMCFKDWAQSCSPNYSFIRSTSSLTSYFNSLSSNDITFLILFSFHLPSATILSRFLQQHSPGQLWYSATFSLDLDTVLCATLLKLLYISVLNHVCSVLRWTAIKKLPPYDLLVTSMTLAYQSRYDC